MWSPWPSFWRFGNILKLFDENSHFCFQVFFAVYDAIMFIPVLMITLFLAENNLCAKLFSFKFLPTRRRFGIVLKKFSKACARRICLAWLHRNRRIHCWRHSRTDYSGYQTWTTCRIYAETGMEWMVTAIACFKCGFPGKFLYVPNQICLTKNRTN